MKAIETRFHGPTNFKGSRVSARDCDGNRVFLGWDHAFNADENHLFAANALCDKMSWDGNLIGGTLKPGSMAWVFTS